MDMRIELILLPVSDVDRAKAFYVDRVGFTLDHDVQPGNGMRVVQLTPHGSSCSIGFGTGMIEPSSPPVQAIHLVVDDIDAVRSALAVNGVDVSAVQDVGGGVRYAYFSDPDRNSWALQEIHR
ncbi:MAG TPA: VOC family protein [Galbitalea sp.]|jgi:predicted enzyme related to lactoylglutathione lyase